MSDYCPRCGGVLFAVSARRVDWRVRCSSCGRRYELDDDFNIIHEPATWLLLVGFFGLTIGLPWLLEALL